MLRSKWSDGIMRKHLRGPACLETSGIEANGRTVESTREGAPGVSFQLAFSPVSRTHLLSNPFRSRCNFYLECEGECCTWMVPRGRVELPTPAFSGPRSTGELPRHRNNQRFYGKAAGVGRGKPKLEIRDTKQKIRQSSQQANMATEVLRSETLIHRLVEFAHPVFFLQHFARL
jgi:hypothetical protein